MELVEFRKNESAVSVFRPDQHSLTLKNNLKHLNPFYLYKTTYFYIFVVLVFFASTLTFIVEFLKLSVCSSSNKREHSVCF